MATVRLIRNQDVGNNMQKELQSHVTKELFPSGHSLNSLHYDLCVVWWEGSLALPKVNSLMPYSGVSHNIRWQLVH